MSHIGEQLVVKDGYKGLVAGRTYHYLGRFGEESRVILVFFHENPPRAHVDIMRGTDFELGLETGFIATADSQMTLPAWLSNYEGVDIASLDAESKSKRKTRKEDRINKRLKQIQFLLDKEKEILSAEDPVRLINKLVYQNNENMNETRIRLWLFSYLCFGRSKLALLPPSMNNGKWEREKRSHSKKFGKPSLSKGRNSGSGVTEDMKNKMLAGFAHFKKRGRFLSKIYSKTMAKNFKCNTRRLENGKYEFYNMKGDPFPTQWQFHYWIHKLVGKERVQIALYGEARTRKRLSESKGTFSESVANLLEHIEADGYFLSEVPRGSRDGELMKPMCTVKLRDWASGFTVGIGFSIGGERLDAYKMALFSMSIPKDVYCAMYGLDISNDVWPSVGLPSWITFDRGPGAVETLIEEVEYRIPMRELSPSYAGQSKAIVESSHPRKVKVEGKPSYTKSDLTYIEMARREILRAVRDNEKSDASARMTPDMIRELKIFNPLNAWKYLDERMRTDAHPIPFDTAVRNFLTKMEFSARKNGVYLEEQRFDSDDLREAGICERVVGKGIYRITGYILPLSVRQAWIEVNGKLVEVKAILPLRGNREELFTTLEDLQIVNKLRAVERSRSREHRAAVDMEYSLMFKRATGKDWDAGIRKSGRAKRNTVAARAEFADIKKMTTGVKRK